MNAMIIMFPYRYAITPLYYLVSLIRFFYLFYVSFIALMAETISMDYINDPLMLTSEIRLNEGLDNLTLKNVAFFIMHANSSYTNVRSTISFI